MMLGLLLELLLVLLKVMWAMAVAAGRWIARPREKRVSGQVCVVTGAGGKLGRLFALEFARRRAVLVLWDINPRSNEETAELVRQVYRDQRQIQSPPDTEQGKNNPHHTPHALYDMGAPHLWI